MMNSIIEGLNEEQRKAVETLDGPVLIVAGAGSGKTRVLTSRIAMLIERGTAPEQILALTFTKKAASEMKERIAAMVGTRSAWKINMGTFHSVFVRILRDYADVLGYPRTFTIYDTGDSVSALKACIRELKLDEKVYKPKEVLSRISMAKNNLCTADAYRANATVQMNDRAARKPEIFRIYLLYDKLCRQSGVMDFDDILLNMNLLLRDHPEAHEEIAGRFTHILVDEYQDTNLSQYTILRKLGQFHHNICVVGDDSQSIYAFRGARIENILNFRKDYQDNKVFRLERNYRSTKTIVNAANSLIANNENRIPKSCTAVGEEGEKIRLVKSYSEQEEAMLIASAIIARMQSDHAEYQDFAVLYRTNSQSRVIEEALRRRNLPYMIYSGNSFFERAEVKDMMAYLKLAVNPRDDESFRRVVNKPARGIGDTSLAALATAAREHGCTLFEACSAEDLEKYGLKTAALKKITAFRDLIAAYAVRAINEDCHEVSVSLAAESGLYAYFKEDTSIEGQSRAANIEELLNSIAFFREQRHDEYVRELIDAGASAENLSEADFPAVPLADFIEDISLLSNVDVDEGENTNRIALMTVHSAKGLEFPYVFISGMEENLFPSGGMLASENDIEEERRLFYVAVTRAKKAVTLTFANTRMRNGKHESNAPSRFLREIAPQYIANPLRREDFRVNRDGDGGAFGGFRFGSGRASFSAADSSSRKASNGVSAGRSAVSTGSAPTQSAVDKIRNRPLPPKIPDEEFTPVPMERLAAGQRIEHNRFGPGLIKEITGQVPDLKAKIAFDRYGEKLLLLKYAKIRFENVAE